MTHDHEADAEAGADARVQDCLDRRVHPLDDEQAAEALLADPRALADYARLQERLDMLATMVPETRSRRPVLPFLAGIAATLALSWVAWGYLATDDAAAASDRPKSRLVGITVTESTAPSAATLSWSVRESFDAATDRAGRTSFHRTHIVVTETTSRSL